MPEEKKSFWHKSRNTGALFPLLTSSVPWEKSDSKVRSGRREHDPPPNVKHYSTPSPNHPEWSPAFGLRGGIYHFVATGFS